MNKKPDFSQYTWPELANIAAIISTSNSKSEAFEIACKYNLTDKFLGLSKDIRKQVQLTNGKYVSVRILDFYHDYLANGSKAGISFMFTDAITHRKINYEHSNSGGWKNSVLRQYLQNDALELLPYDLRNNIVPIIKLTNNVGNARDQSAISATLDYLWLISIKEICGNRPSNDFGIGYDYVPAIWNQEGEQYAFFCTQDFSFFEPNPILSRSANPISRECLLDQENKEKSLSALVLGAPTLPQHEEDWWLRSPDPSNPNTFCFVSVYGNPSLSDGAAMEFDVLPGFAF